MNDVSSPVRCGQYMTIDGVLYPVVGWLVGLGGRGTGLAEAASLVSSQWLCHQSIWSDAPLNLHSLLDVSFLSLHEARPPPPGLNGLNDTWYG